MSLIKYRTGGFGHLIEKIEVARETKHFVYLGKHRHAKDSGWQKYFDSWEDARDHLTEKAKRAVDSAKRSLERAEDQLSMIQELKP